MDGVLDGQDYVCGDHLTYVDVVTYPLMNFLAAVSLPIPPELAHVTAYMGRLATHEMMGQNG